MDQEEGRGRGEESAGVSGSRLLLQKEQERRFSLFILAWQKSLTRLMLTSLSQWISKECLTINVYISDQCLWHNWKYKVKTTQKQRRQEKQRTEIVRQRTSDCLSIGFHCYSRIFVIHFVPSSPSHSFVCRRRSKPSFPVGLLLCTSSSSDVVLLFFFFPQNLLRHSALLSYLPRHLSTDK